MKREKMTVQAGKSSRYRRKEITAAYLFYSAPDYRADPVCTGAADLCGSTVFLFLGFYECTAICRRTEFLERVCV